MFRTALHSPRPTLRPHRFAAAAQSCNARLPRRMLARIRGVSAAEPTPVGLAPLPWKDTPEQLQALEQLRSRLSKSDQDCPDEDTLKWFLRDRYFDVKEAEEKLVTTLKWRRAFKADKITLEDVKAEYATNKSSVHDKLDNFERPVLVVRANKHNPSDFPIEDSKRLCIYTLNTALSKLPPGREQIMGLIDLRGISLSNVDLKFVAFMVDAFFVYYPRRMGQVLLVDAPWIFKGPWELIKPLLRKYAALIRFVSRQEVADEYFTADTLPAGFKD